MSIFYRNRIMAITIPATEFGNLAKIVGYDETFFASLTKALTFPPI